MRNSNVKLPALIAHFETTLRSDRALDHVSNMQCYHVFFLKILKLPRPELPPMSLRVSVARQQANGTCLQALLIPI